MNIVEYPSYLPYHRKEDLLNYLEHKAPLPTFSFVNKIIITSNESYGNAIRSVNKQATFTENSLNVSIAKTINDIIVIKDFVIEHILRQTPEVEECHFTLFHEIGHSKDYSIRIHKSYTLTRPYRVKNLTEYYANIILDEIAANSFAAKFIDVQTFNALVNKRQSDIQNSLNALRNQMMPISENGKFEIAGEVWVIIYKILEIYTLSFYQKPKENIPLPIKLKRVLREKTFSQLLNRYPNWNTTDFEYLENIWMTLLKDHKLDKYLL